MIKISLLFGLVLMCIGCTGGYITKFGDSFEGQGDYIVISPEKGNDTQKNQWEGKYVQSVRSSFVKNDIISITLKSAYIYNFPERRIKRAANYVASLGIDSPIRGQIVILANVVEFKAGVSPTDAESNGRVVYYSNDVYEGQLINRSFIPIYGPVIFNGEPIMIKFQLMELDQEDNAQLRAVLKNVADIGQSTTGPGSSKLIEGLNKIGDSLISSNADDKFGEYGAVFIPTEARPDEHLPVLRRGDAIFIRKGGNRKTPINWNAYCYNELQAILQIKDKPEDSAICNERFSSPPEFSYIVASIQKNIGTHNMTPTKTHEELQAEIQASSSITAIRNTSSNFSAQVLKNATDNRVRSALKKIFDPSTAAGTRRLEAAIIASALQCSSIASPVIPPTPVQTKAIGEICGEDYASTSLDNGQYEYFINKLVVAKNCLTPEELDDKFWSKDITKLGLSTARATATSRIAACR